MNHKFYFWGASHSGLVKYDCKKPILLDLLNNKNIGDFHTSGRHTLILIDNDLYAVGENENGECSKLINSEHIFNLTKIDLNPIINIKKVICGFENSALITYNNLLYTWGGNKKGQLGLGHKDYLSTPTLVMIDDNINFKVLDICLGLQHSIAITDTGMAYGWGSNKHGQIMPTDSTTSFLTPISLNRSAQQIALGAKYSLFLNSGIVSFNGHVFDNLKIAESFEFDIQNIISISSGWSHFLMLDNLGQVYCTGKNNFGQCSNGTEISVEINSNHNTIHEIKVIKVKLPAKVEKLCCGAESSFAISSKSLYAWGWNEHGALGFGDEEFHSTPNEINIVVNKMVAGGASVIVNGYIPDF